MDVGLFDFCISDFIFLDFWILGFECCILGVGLLIVVIFFEFGIWNLFFFDIVF